MSYNLDDADFWTIRNCKASVGSVFRRLLVAKSIETHHVKICERDTLWTYWIFMAAANVVDFGVSFEKHEK